MSLIAGVEAGGTKFICALADKPDHILREERLPTTSPEETTRRVFQFFETAIDDYRVEHGPLLSLGIGTFGPIDLRPESGTYGYITTTPKSGWENINLFNIFSRELRVKVSLDTDVNAAALGEGYVGMGQDCSTFIYITVGTGIGGGIIVNGSPIHGRLHPELGHIFLKKRSDDDFEGICPYHGQCLEGLCSGTAMESRWGVTAEKLGADHEAWDLEAFYLAQAIMNCVLIVSPERIILGGGVMHQYQLFPRIRKYLKTFLNGYIDDSAILDEPDDFVVPPSLGDRAGITGALVMADMISGNRVV